MLCAFLALTQLEETYGRDLDDVEPLSNPSPPPLLRKGRG
jgi:hypothetical protein